MAERYRLVGAAIEAGIPPEKAKPFASAISAELEDVVNARNDQLERNIEAAVQKIVTEQTNGLRNELVSTIRWKSTAMTALFTLAIAVIAWATGMID